MRSEEVTTRDKVAHWVEQKATHIPICVPVATSNMLGHSWVEEVHVRSPIVAQSAKNAMSTLPSLSLDSLHQLQSTDDVIGLVCEYWDCGRPPSKSQLPHEAKTVRRLLQMWPLLIECNARDAGLQWARYMQRDL